MSLPEMEALRVFASIANHLSVAKAARALGVPRATVSRRLAGLEEQLGARLLRRTTRSMTLTDAGHALLRHSEIVLAAAMEAVRSVRPAKDQVRGDVRLSVGPYVASMLAGVLADFMTAHPEVRLLVHVSNRRVDLQRENVDVAVRASAKLAPGLVARTVARARLAAFAAPTYLKRQGTPRTLADLRAHRCLMSLDETLEPVRTWPTSARRIAARGVVHSDDPAFLLELCRRGAGVAVLPSRLVPDAVSRGEIVPVLPNELRVEGRIAVIYIERTLLPPALRALIDWLVKRAPGALA